MLNRPAHKLRAAADCEGANHASSQTRSHAALWFRRAVFPLFFGAATVLGQFAGAPAAAQTGFASQDLHELAISCVSSLDLVPANQTILRDTVARHGFAPVSKDEAETFVGVAPPYVGKTAVSALFIPTLRLVSADSLEQARGYARSRDALVKSADRTRDTIARELENAPNQLGLRNGPIDQNGRNRSMWWLDDARTIALVADMNFARSTCGLIGIPHSATAGLLQALETAFDVTFNKRQFPLIEEYTTTVDTFSPLLKQNLSPVLTQEAELPNPALMADVTIYRITTGTADQDTETSWLFAASNTNSF